MSVYYDRYKNFTEDGGVKIIPFIKLDKRATDKRIVYKQGETRFDKLSQDYYGNPYHGWLIMLANPQFGGLEFDIKNDTVIRIPFPFNESLQDYQEKVERYIRLYGK